jgi:hypothetical protein
MAFTKFFKSGTRHFSIPSQCRDGAGGRGWDWSQVIISLQLQIVSIVQTR